MPPRPDEERREQLLDELEAIVLSEGFAHLRIGALAARLHCSRSTLYKLAPSKPELFALVYRRWIDRATASSIAGAEAEATPAEKIVRLGQLSGEWQRQGSAAFWRDVKDTPETAAAFTRSTAKGYRQVQHWLEEGIAGGVVRPMNTEFVAYLVWSAARASRDPDLLAEFGITTDEALTILGELIARGTAA